MPRKSKDTIDKEKEVKEKKKKVEPKTKSAPSKTVKTTKKKSETKIDKKKVATKKEPVAKKTTVGASPRDAQPKTQKKTATKKAKATVEKKTTVKKVAIKKSAITNVGVADHSDPKPEKKPIAKKTTAVASPKDAQPKTQKKTATKKAKTTTEKKTATKKKTPAKTTKSKIVVKKTAKPMAIAEPEYYDLPYRYNQTLVKVLAQTPKMLFVYWDISDEDRSNFVREYGEKFFDLTVPFLRIKNETLNYTFEVDVDDFANSWYLHINDANSKYTIELLRKQKPFKEHLINHEVYITSSNNMNSPNDHILFEKEQKMIYFKDIKTGKVSVKNIPHISLMRNMGKIYNIYELYKKMYKEEITKEAIDLNNPSSGNPSSTFK